MPNCAEQNKFPASISERDQFLRPIKQHLTLSGIDKLESQLLSHFTNFAFANSYTADPLNPFLLKVLVVACASGVFREGLFHPLRPLPLRSVTDAKNEKYNLHKFT